MRNRAFILLTALTLFSGFSKASELELEIPKLVFAEVSTAVEIKAVNGELPAYVFQMHNGAISTDTAFVTQTDAGATVDLIIHGDKPIEFQKHTIVVQNPVSAIPLWMSILPPLFAIFLALVFKEVIFSLVSGVFVGAAIMGFYAEGFIGIFTGFFRIIDTIF